MEAYLSWIKPKEQTRRLLEKARDIWSGYLGHPFVRGIGDGSLDKEKFRFYLKQDYLYLVEYAKVFAIGIAKADDEEVMRFFSDAVHAIFTSEMNIHRAYMQRFGVTEKEIADTTPSLGTTALIHLTCCALHTKAALRKFWRQFYRAPSVTNTSQKLLFSNIRRRARIRFTANGSAVTQARVSKEQSAAC